MTSPADPYATLARQLGGELKRRWTLHGGVSAKVEALELLLPDGTSDRVVVRQGVTATEHAVLEVLADAGLEVPRPRLSDLSGRLLAAPFLVMPFIDGANQPHTLAVGLERMADFLARLHALNVEALDLPATLERREDPVPELLEYLPDGYEAIRSIPSVMAGRESSQAPPSMLHGDFWPGNIVWDGDRIAAVIDWEHAAVGDPLSDLACSRVELMCAYGEAAMETFTVHYVQARGQTVDGEQLALWEVCVSSAALALMGSWGLDPRVEAARRAATGVFLDRAAAKLAAC